MKELRIIVAGGRDFDSYEAVDIALTGYLFHLGFKDGYEGNTYEFPKIKIVSGCAKGADALGQMFAIHNRLECVNFPANWDKYGKAAGLIRNRQMAEYASSGGEDCRGILFAFWDGVSRGTKNMIDTAEKYGLEVHIIRYKKRNGECDLTGAALINGR